MTESSKPSNEITLAKHCKEIAGWLFATGTGSDFLIKTRSRSYKVHSWILCAWGGSEYWRKCIKGPFLESQSRQLDLSIDDDYDILGLLLYYIYTGRRPVMSHNVWLALRESDLHDLKFPQQDYRDGLRKTLLAGVPPKASAETTMEECLIMCWTQIKLYELSQHFMMSEFAAILLPDIKADLLHAFRTTKSTPISTDGKPWALISIIRWVFSAEMANCGEIRAIIMGFSWTFSCKCIGLDASSEAVAIMKEAEPTAWSALNHHNV
jgi:hypothetical protein